MTVAKEVEITGESQQSFDDAVAQGFAAARRSFQGISGFEITRWFARVEPAEQITYQVTMHVVCEGESGSAQPGQGASSPTAAGSDRTQFAQTQGIAGMSPGDEAPPDSPTAGENLCRTCGGSGTFEGQPCTNCGGTGVVMTGIGGA